MRTRVILSLLLTTSLSAQSLKVTINELLSSNPIILERLKNYNATKEEIGVAEAGYYPSIDLSFGAGIEETKLPTSEQNFNVYQNSLKYTHNIFNGFSTLYKVQEQEYRTLSAAYSYIEKVNNTAFEMANAYLQVMKNQELLLTAEENVAIDEEILSRVNKLYESGLTTLSEVNKIESSLALAKSNLVVQENINLDVSYNLQRILGRALNPSEMIRPSVDETLLPQTMQKTILYSMQNNPSLLVSDFNIKLAQATHKENYSGYYPSIDIEISKTMTNNISGVAGENERTRAMAYLNFNIFRGFEDSRSIQKSVSKIHQEVEIKNTLKRRVIEGLSLSWSANTKLKEQLEHLNTYKKFSKQTLDLYSQEYDLGRRSLLDLLSAQNDFIKSKAQIINTEYSLLYSKYRILDSMGILVPSIMNEGKVSNKSIIYDNVGLTGQTPSNEDSLPILYDRDRDLIVDSMDICDNSLNEKMKDIYGCRLIDYKLQQIERYEGFLFNGDSLEHSSKKELEKLIQQLREYGLKKY